MRAVLMFHNCEGQSHKTVSADHNFWRERRAEADSNRGPSAYQPSALPLGQTGSLTDLLSLLIFTCRGKTCISLDAEVCIAHRPKCRSAGFPSVAGHFRHRKTVRSSWWMVVDSEHRLLKLACSWSLEIDRVPKGNVALVELAVIIIIIIMDICKAPTLRLKALSSIQLLYKLGRLT